MNKRVKTTTAILLAMGLTSGCATVTRGSNEAYAIETTPPGADVTLTAKGTTQICTTPCSMKVPRRPPLVIRIEKAGYQTLETTITSSVQGGGAAGMAGNVLVGGFIGAGIDAATGAMNGHNPNPLTVELEKAAPTIGDDTATTEHDGGQ